MDGPPSQISFAPVDGGVTGFVNSVTLAATTSAQSITLPGSTGTASSPTAAQPVFYKQIQIANQTASWIYVNIGPGAVAAATVAAGYPVAPGAVVVVTINGLSYIASCICAAGSSGGSVTFTRGQGL
jgi:hypothetical protein